MRLRYNKLYVPLEPLNRTILGVAVPPSCHTLPLFKELPNTPVADPFVATNSSSPVKSLPIVLLM